MHFDDLKGDSRPVTLVFAKSREESAIKEALFKQRTAVLWRNMLVGKEEFLKPIFEKSIEIDNTSISFGINDHQYIQITNHSDINYDLLRTNKVAEITTPEKLTLYGGKTVLFSIEKTEHLTKGKKKLDLSYKVQNLLLTPEKPLDINLILEVEQK
jgi:hypothetical protein